MNNELLVWCLEEGRDLIGQMHWGCLGFKAKARMGSSYEISLECSEFYH